MYGVPSLPAAVSKSAYQSSDLVKFLMWVRLDNFAHKGSPSPKGAHTRDMVPYSKGGKCTLCSRANPGSGMNCISTIAARTGLLTCMFGKVTNHL